MQENIHVNHEIQDQEHIQELDPANPQDLKLVESFFDHQQELLGIARTLPKAEKVELRDYLGLMSQGYNTLKHLENIHEQNTYQQLLALIKDGQIVGVCMYFSYPSENPDYPPIEGSFVGVDHDHLKQGIATKLVKTRHKLMKGQGIHQYHASVWDASKNTIIKAGGKLTQVIDPVFPSDSEYLVTI